MLTSRRRLQTILRGLLLIGMVTFASSVTNAATAQEIDKAIELAKQFVYGRQTGGLWEKHPAVPDKAEATRDRNNVTAGQWGGDTALAVYALLAAGESPEEPKLAQAIKFLRTTNLNGVYALGLRSQLFTFLPPSAEVKKEAAADVSRYLSAVAIKGTGKGMFDYASDNTISTRNDHSVSQYGVLGAWACERSGVEIPTKFWQIVEDGWNRDQLPEGAWNYTNEGSITSKASAAMAVAGVATLFITQDYVHASNGINCTGNVVNPHIEAGLKWIGDHFDRVFTDGNGQAPYYAIYGVERVGVASGRKYLGNVNWYDRGADYLVAHQDMKTGSWVDELEQTCFGMLFLSRGRAPVVFNKLEYNTGDKEGNWNERPRDIANLTHWIGKQTERDLNWQIINLHAPVLDLLDAPVLYLAGNKPLQFTTSEEAKLKEYCEAGGLILGHADCGNSNFAESFRKLGAKLFPLYEFRQLPVGHAIYTNEQYGRKAWKTQPQLQSLSNGVREMMILAPLNDPARHWQLEETGKNQPEYELADDILLYAIDKKNLLEKGKTFLVQRSSKVSATHISKLARLQYNGNWDPEPGGWRRLSAILHNDARIDLQVSVVKLGSNQLGDGKSGGPTIATLTGTNTLKLDSIDRLEIKNFVAGGGTLIVDAAGGNSDFAVTAQAELQTIFGTDAAQLTKALPPGSTLYNLPGRKIAEFKYRSFARNIVGSSHGPLLAGMTVNGRIGVYFSRLDLSAGLVGQPTDGIVGYDPATATTIMTNLIISLQGQ